MALLARAAQARNHDGNDDLKAEPASLNQLQAIKSVIPTLFLGIALEPTLRLMV